MFKKILIIAVSLITLVSFSVSVQTDNSFIQSGGSSSSFYFNSSSYYNSQGNTNCYYDFTSQTVCYEYSITPSSSSCYWIETCYDYSSWGYYNNECYYYGSSTTSCNWSSESYANCSNQYWVNCTTKCIYQQENSASVNTCPKYEGGYGGGGGGGFDPNEYGNLRINEINTKNNSNLNGQAGVSQLLAGVGQKEGVQKPKLDNPITAGGKGILTRTGGF
jgi:hypothetical protein